MQELSWDDFIGLTAEGKFRKLMHAHNELVWWGYKRQEKPLNRLCPQCGRVLEIIGDHITGEWKYYCSYCERSYDEDYYKEQKDYKQMWEKLKEQVEEMNDYYGGRPSLLRNAYIAGEFANTITIKSAMETLEDERKK